MAILLGATKGPRKYAVDKDLVEDLYLFMENDSTIMGNYEKAFLPNIARKIGSGKFDKSKLPKLMEYLYKNNERTIKQNYADVKLNPRERELLAKEWADRAINDITYNYDNIYNSRTNKYEPIKKFTKGKTISGIFLGK
jgi:hypothetical protein